MNGLLTSGGRGRFIVIEGIDGSGKTTICHRLEAALQDIPVTYTSRKEICTGSPQVETSMRELAAIVWPKEQSHLAFLPSDYRVHLHAAWYILLSELVIKPKLEACRVILTDGWYYKFMAHLLVYGCDREYLGTVFSHVLQPDYVIMLDPDVEVVWERRRNFGPVEMGLYLGYPELGKSSFVDNQSRVRSALRRLAKESGWDIVGIEDSASVDDTSTIVESRIRGLLSG
jgi:dTMP kinase